MLLNWKYCNYSSYEFFVVFHNERYFVARFDTYIWIVLIVAASMAERKLRVNLFRGFLFSGIGVEPFVFVDKKLMLQEC